MMRTDKNYIRLCTALFLLILPVKSFAAVIVPSTADPARAQQQIAPPPPEVHAVSPSTAAPAITPQQAPAGADKIVFVLSGIQIDGMTVYKDTDVAPLYQKLVGQKISLVDIYALANELTAKYRNDGYILSQVIVPPQHIKDGHITLRAVEGYIDEVHIQNKTKNDTASYYEGYGDMIKMSRPLNEHVLEKYMLIMNDLPGITAKSVLSPSPYTQGASDLTITVEHKDYDASAETDNRGSRFIGPEQYNVSGRLNNVFGQNEGITVRGALANNNMKADIFGLTYPIGYMGTMINFNASFTTTNPGFTLAQFDIRGMTHDYYLSITQPFIRSRNENLSAGLKLEYFDSTRTDNLGDPEIEDRLRIERINVQYQNADRFQGMNTFTTELSNGIDALNASETGDANMSEADADPQFFKATMEATRTQALPDIYELYVAATGQRSADNLPSSELFGVGGASYGSAYDSSEITGKDGMAGRLELRANTIVPDVQRLQPYTFYDIGKIWDPQSTESSDRILSIADVGVGLRLLVNPNLSGSFEYAKPLTKPISSTDSKSGRAFYMLTAKF